MWSSAFANGGFKLTSSHRRAPEKGPWAVPVLRGPTAASESEGRRAALLARRSYLVSPGVKPQVSLAPREAWLLMSLLNSSGIAYFGRFLFLKNQTKSNQTLSSRRSLGARLEE